MMYQSHWDPIGIWSNDTDSDGPDGPDGPDDPHESHWDPLGIVAVDPYQMGCWDVPNGITELLVGLEKR